jgi:hypothetical protein
MALKHRASLANNYTSLRDESKAEVGNSKGGPKIQR